MRDSLPLLLISTVLGLAGCATKSETVSQTADAKSPPMKEGGPNWSEIDKTVERVKAREAERQQKPKVRTVNTPEGTATEITVWESK